MFGWFKKNDDVSALTKLLESERAERIRLEQVAIEVQRKIEEQLVTAEFDEKFRTHEHSLAKKSQALTHLKAAERYIDSFNQAKGARRSELQAIIDSRLEKAAQLGFAIKGDITQAIMDLE